MTDSPTPVDLTSLVAELEAFADSPPVESSAEVDKLLAQIAAAFMAATFGNYWPRNATALGASAGRALLQLPATLFSARLGEALWEAARFCGARRINRELMRDIGTRLTDIGTLLNDAEIKRRGHVISSIIGTFRGDYGAGLEHAWSSLKSAKASGSAQQIASGWNNIAIALNGLGLHQAAMRCLEKGLESARAGEHEIRHPILNNLALTALHAGEFQRGLRAAEAAREVTWSDASVRGAISQLLGGSYYAQLLLASGAVQQARTICDEIAPIAEKLDSDVYRVEAQMSDGLCRVYEGDADDGLDRIRRTVETARKIQTELAEVLNVAIRANEVAGDAAAASMYRRERSLLARMMQTDSLLAQHRAHLARLQSADGVPPASLERKAETVERAAITAELREDPSGLRVFRVGRLARLLAKAVDWSDADADALELAARLHDIGKVSVADEVVKKAGALTESEKKEIEGHCAAGAELLRQTQLEIAPLAADVAAYHHECWDGSGYPHGIGGTAIPLAARIVAIADSFDAMTSDRPYRRAIGYLAALKELEAGAGTRYDPNLVPVFCAAFNHLVTTVEDVDGYLCEPADRSAFIRVHRQITEGLARAEWSEPPSPA